MRTVQRHEIDMDYVARQAESYQDMITNWLLPQLPEAPGLMAEAQTFTRSLWGYRLAKDPTSDMGETWGSTVMAMQAGTAAFKVASQPAGSIVEWKFDEYMVTMRSEGLSIWTTGSEWLDALYLAMVCREKERTDFLCSVPLDLMQRSAQGGVPAPYLYPWIQALQSWWRRDDDAFDRLREAVEAADPEAANVHSERMALLDFPVMRVFAAATEQDRAGFNDALFEGLEWHRQYWTRDEDRRRKPDSYVSLPLLAVACLATELGVPVEVESEYLPERLVAGAWHGEFSP